MRSFSVMAQSPLSLKTTIPMCLAAGISNLVSDLTMASNFYKAQTDGIWPAVKCLVVNYTPELTSHSPGSYSGDQRCRSSSTQTKASELGIFCSEELASAETLSLFIITTSLMSHHSHHIVNGQSRVLMLKIQRLNIECSVQRSAILDPGDK